MAKWFYYNGSGEKIEVTDGQLKGLAKAGQITPETVVETEDGKTAPARKIKGLTFTEAAQPGVAPSETVLTEPKPDAQLTKSSITGKVIVFLKANLWRTTAIVLAAVCLVSFVERHVSWEHPSSLVGKWKFDTGSGNYSESDMELLEDGTGTWLNNDITWKVERGRLHITPVHNADTWDYKKWGSTLTLTDGNKKIIYKKQD